MVKTLTYENLTLLPSIQGVTIIGDKTFEDYGLVPLSVEDVEEIMLEVFGYIL